LDDGKAEGLGNIAQYQAGVFDTGMIVMYAGALCCQPVLSLSDITELVTNLPKTSESKNPPAATWRILFLQIQNVSCFSFPAE